MAVTVFVFQNKKLLFCDGMQAFINMLNNLSNQRMTLYFWSFTFIL